MKKDMTDLETVEFLIASWKREERIIVHVDQALPDVLAIRFLTRISRFAIKLKP